VQPWSETSIKQKKKSASSTEADSHTDETFGFRPEIPTTIEMQEPKEIPPAIPTGVTTKSKTVIHTFTALKPAEGDVRHVVLQVTDEYSEEPDHQESITGVPNQTQIAIPHL